MINTKTKGELGRRIEYDVEHDLFHAQNVYSDDYITPTFVEYVRQLEAQIEKLIDFVLSKTECCDVCPITDTCNNSEGVCPYAFILAEGEEEVTREWLMQFISRR